MKTGEKDYKNYQLMRCCNIFPTYFKNISEMTSYLAHLKEVGINVVWINPIQLAGSESMKKSNAITGNAENVIRSLYAMDSTKFIDPRFSVVEKDEDGDMVFLPEYISKLEMKKSKKFQKIIEDTKEKRESIKIHLEEIKIQDSLLKKNDGKIEDEKATIKKELEEKEYFLSTKDNITTSRYKIAPLQGSNAIL